MTRRRSRPAAGVVVLVALSIVLGAPVAGAEPGPITLVSTNGVEQAERAETPALATDGRYLAFAGQLGGIGGIFRKDLTTGEVVPVVGRREVDGASSASAPSISADGRFVSFTTSEQLDPTDDPAADTSDVYVADMSNSPPTYTLVSARDGSSLGLTYEGTGGAVASSRVAISADGNEVVFATTGASDLTGAAGASEAPTAQVAVRDLGARRTILISTTRDPATGTVLPATPVAGGAAYAKLGRTPGAAISADGSTVAWIATNVLEQAAVDPAEAGEVAALEGGSGGYDEPLWRRVPTPSDPLPPTRRMVSAAQFPEAVSGRNRDPYSVCGDADTAGWDVYAPLLVETTPSLSADGRMVALVGQPSTYADAYLIDMSGPPVAHQLTRAIPPPLNEPCESNSKYAGTSGAISGVAISPAGDRVALTTARQRFPLTPPSLIGSPPNLVGLPELYLVDLPLGTVQRLTHGATESEPSLLLTTPESFPIGSGANSVSFDAGGETMAFASQASNLVPGDGNGTVEAPAGDAFLVSDPRNVPKPATSALTPRPPSLRTTPRRILTARATSRPDGSVRVAVSVPGAGTLKAAAKTNGHGAKSRLVAAARRRARLASTFAFSLKPKRRFSRRVHAAGGVEAKLRLQFRGTAGEPLRLLLHVRFHAHPKKNGSRR